MDFTLQRDTEGPQ